MINEDLTPQISSFSIYFRSPLCFTNDTEIEEYISELIKNQTQMNQARRREIEGDPIIYIVAVLIFYSSFILILMINYMKKVRTRNILVTQFRILLIKKHSLRRGPTGPSLLAPATHEKLHFSNRH